ncbi:Peroxiredoxin-6 [Hondaea fermentalgiana]|uniref:Peroxiredoxin-6 n=1 Tax=Hondaea fermentalgiana TaxID=2315210 RepID=A0A2R5GCG5_9STRA|nr:Peroxiredoxin-6 [Hondaea fermentalgiana]|eukprot:GBG28652.1 Peroxiredoxin-6 [Hondaea fermentalgiana]
MADKVLSEQQGPPKLGFPFPDFEADTTEGKMKFSEYAKDSWAILFSHPADFTPVCTTELGTVSKYLSEFEKRGVKMAALSCDPVDSHKKWIEDIQSSQSLSGGLGFPIIADEKREIALKLGMLDPAELDAEGIPLTARAVFIVNPAFKLALSLLYPATTGRNFDEIVRVIDSLQLTANHSVATPANWKGGEKTMVVPSLSDEQATAKFPKGFEKVDVPSGKGYLRFTPDPRD